MKTWKLKIKEKGNDTLLTPTYSFQDDDETKDRDFIIWFFGLNEKDVEWYELELEQTCCICGKTFTGYGNNPYPVKDSGRCCDVCNYEKVLPSRLKLLK